MAFIKRSAYNKLVEMAREGENLVGEVEAGLSTIVKNI